MKSNEYEVKSARLTSEGLHLEVISTTLEGDLRINEKLIDLHNNVYHVIESYYHSGCEDEVYKVFRNMTVSSSHVDLTRVVLLTLTLRD